MTQPLPGQTDIDQLIALNDLDKPASTADILIAAATIALAYARPTLTGHPLAMQQEIADFATHLLAATKLFRQKTAKKR